MKKLLALILSLVLTAGLLTACGNSAQKEAEAETPAASAAEETLAEEPEIEDTLTEEPEVEKTLTEAPTVEETAADAASEEAPAEDSAAEEGISEDAADETLALEESDVVKAPETLADYTPGTWEGHVYTNEVLGIKMTFPETYTVISGEDLNGAMDDTMGAIADNADVNFNVASVYSDFMAIAPDQIGNVILSVETNTHNLDNSGYLEALIHSFEVMEVPCEIIQEEGTQTVGETDFSMIAMALDYSELTGIEGNTAIQAYMVHTDENLVYYFVVTFSEATLEELGGVMDSMEALQ